MPKVTKLRYCMVPVERFENVGQYSALNARKGTTWYVPGFMRALDYNGFWYDNRTNEFRSISRFDREKLQIAGSSPRDYGYGEPYVFLFFFIPREDYELHIRLAEFGTVCYD